MYKILIISDSNKHFEEAIQEYIKRLWKKCEIIKLKPIKNGTEKQIIEKETDEIIKKIEKLKWFKIVLNPVWKSLNTNKLFNLIEEKKQTNSHIIFIIGWANWLNYDFLKDYIDFDLNLWEMTMPHSLALLVIIEQVYRLEMIKKGTAYNK
jgi:23S rRNA (pseudouridine1915-N3)-methyltransferase